MAKRQNLTVGGLFRKSLTGKMLKLAITNKYTMSGRDKLLHNILKDKPEYKRFIQYLTGGVKGDKITELSPEVKQDVIRAHHRGMYPERDEYRVKEYNPELDKQELVINDLLAKGKITHEEHQKRLDKIWFEKNPNYNPKSNLLSTYTQPSRTANQLGHATLTPTEDGAILRDRWKVDEMPDDKFHQMYDLQEGGTKAALAYRASKFLGINRPFDYEVPLTNRELLYMAK